MFYPESTDKSVELKNMLIQELSSCSEYEMRVILSVVKSLRDTLKHDME